MLLRRGPRPTRNSGRETPVNDEQENHNDMEIDESIPQEENEELGTSSNVEIPSDQESTTSSKNSSTVIVLSDDSDMETESEATWDPLGDDRVMANTSLENTQL